MSSCLFCRKGELDLAAKHATNGIDFFAKPMRDISLGVFLDPALYGEIEEVELAERAEKLHFLQKVQFVLVVFEPDEFSQFGHLLIALSFLLQQSFLEMDECRAGCPPYPDHLAVAISDVTHGGLVPQLKHPMLLDCSIGLELHLHLAQIPIKQHVLVVLAEQREALSQQEWLEQWNHYQEIVRPKGRAEIIEIWYSAQLVANAPRLLFGGLSMRK
jgi:hypothetical protein